MTREMDKQQRRAQRILRQFGHYVDESDAERKRLETPTIARTRPKAYARIKRNVGWQLMAKGKAKGKVGK